jgi:CheY-like chemotaxis protein
MQKALERHGYQTASAGDGAEAIRKAKEMKPDLIFMDVVMPGVNGFQATRKLASDPDRRTASGACARGQSTISSSRSRWTSSSKKLRPPSRADGPMR